MRRIRLLSVVLEGGFGAPGASDFDQIRELASQQKLGLILEATYEVNEAQRLQDFCRFRSVLPGPFQPPVGDGDTCLTETLSSR